MKDKHPIHTTISTEAFRILDRFTAEFGAKNTAIEKALLSFGLQSFGGSKADLEPVKHWAKNKILEPMLEKIPEGSIIGVSGPPWNEIVLLMFAVIDSHQKGEHSAKQCAFITAGKLTNFISVTKDLGMGIDKYVKGHFLNIYEENSIDKIFRIVNASSPKILVIEADSLKENGRSDVQKVFESSGWKILSEEIKERETICFLISKNAEINRYCDISVEFIKPRIDLNSIFVRVIENIVGVSSPLICKLEINGGIKLDPVLEIIATEPEKVSLNNNGTRDSLSKIAKHVFVPKNNSLGEKKNIARIEKIEGGSGDKDTKERIREVEKLGVEIPPDVLNAIYGNNKINSNE